jgi:Cys-rich protein (TIGR01571 family)
MSWNNNLFDILNTKDCGLLCCFNHTCCGPCIWGDALKAAGVKDAGKYAAGAIVGSVLGSSNNEFVSSIGNVTSTFSFVSGRAALAKKYGIQESTLSLYLPRICCPICAQIQEVNTVNEKESLIYGCGTLEKEKVIAPLPQTIKRPSMTGRSRK